VQLIDFYLLGSIQSIFGFNHEIKPGVFVLPTIAAGRNTETLVKPTFLIIYSICPLQWLYQPKPAADLVILEYSDQGSALTADKTVMCSTPSALHFLAKLTGIAVSIR
jgi:hypothetical protein